MRLSFLFTNMHIYDYQVASFILFACSYNLSWAPVSYVVVSEAASTRVKEKTNLFASVISIITTFVTSFTIPYLLNAPYAALGAKVGFIYGSINWVMVGVAYFFIPEMKGRSLEEVDELFASGESLRNFSKAKVTPTATYIEDTARKEPGSGEAQNATRVDCGHHVGERQSDNEVQSILVA